MTSAPPQVLKLCANHVIRPEMSLVVGDHVTSAPPQVLKLCANHVIRPEMSLAPLSSSQSAWVWSANDFSEGEASQETLAVKFKTPELVRGG